MMTMHLSKVLARDERLSEAIKEKWKDPEYRRKQRDARMGHKAWGKGKTKETDKRIAKMAVAIQKQYDNGREPWIKGRTKETDPILMVAAKKHSETLKRLFREGKLTALNKGIPLSEETKRKISESKVGVPSPRKGMSYDQIYGVEEAKIKRLNNSLAKRGSNNPHWKGGDPKRYRLVNNGGRVMSEHRLIAERFFGRRLGFNEVVHHMDGDPKNNDPANLLLMNRGEHVAFEWALHKDEVEREDAFQLGISITLMGDR